MIELLLQGERALAMGLVDQAERLYRQAAGADPRNSIAVVGLARVALERGDEPGAWRLAKEALSIDPENIAARRLAGRLEEVYAFRGESLPELAGATAGDAVGTAGAGGATPGALSAPAPSPRDASASPVAPPRTPAPAAAAAAEGHRGVVDRLLRRNRG